MSSMTEISSNMNLKPNDIFWAYHSEVNFKVQRELTKFISSKIKYQSNFILITYSLKIGKKETDDKIYYENPELIKYLPRAMTIVLDKEYNFVTSLTGSSKFSGADNLDEDDSEEGKIYNIYNSVKTISWVLSKSCEITKLEKANGKYAIMKIFTYKENDIIIFGSKNMHHLSYLYRIENYLAENEVSDIVKSIGKDIINNLENLLKLKSLFDKGYSLVGELEDGMHFVPGDNTVSWFGLFKDGQPSEPLSTLKILSEYGLKTVENEIVFKEGDSKEKLKYILSMSRIDKGEGSVLYIRNTSTEETQLVKSKSAIYKIKRMFRQKWLSNPLDIHINFLNRIVETNNYHLLNTKASINIARKLLDFGLWLSKKNFPVGVLDFKPIESVRGQIPNGFSPYWTKFIEDTNSDDIELTFDDFGEFDREEFLTSPELKFFPELNFKNKPKVIFLQDIQGGGKSTIASMLNNFELIEQDICYGCTKITQFKLLHYIRNNKNVVISRCNANEDHYKAYLKIALDNGCRVLFVSSHDMESEIRLAVALSGILNRSENGDSVLIGRKEYPFLDVIKFTKDTWKSFRYHSNVIKIKTFDNPKHLVEDFKTILKKNDENIKIFIESNKENFMKLRRPIKQIVDEIQEIIDNPPTEFLVKKQLKDVSYVSINIDDNSRLIELVNKNCSVKNGTIFCHHITQYFFGTKNKKKINIDIVPEFEKCKIFIDSLVIDMENGSSAFSVRKIIDSRNNNILVDSGLPHITAFVSANSRPADSIKFISKKDETVRIIPLDLQESAVCIWN